MQNVPALGKQFKTNIFSRGISLSCSVIQAVAIAHCLGAENTGQLYYLFANIQFAVLLLGLNTDAGIYYFAVAAKTDTAKLAGLSVIIAAAMGVISFLILSLFSSAGISAVSIWITILAVSGYYLLNCFTRICNGRGVFDMPNYISAATTLIFIFVLLLKVDVSIKLSVYFLLIFLQSLILFCFLLKKRFITRRFILPNISERRMIFRYSAKALVANLLFFLVLRFDYWIVKSCCSSVDLGIYLQATKLGQMLLLLPQTMASVIFTNSSHQTDQTKKLIARIGRLMLQGYCLLAFILLFEGKQMWRVLLGDSFTAMNPILLLLLPGIFSLSVLSMLSAWFAGQGNLRINVTGALIACIVIVIGDLVCIPVFGITAAAIVSSVGYALNFLYAFYMYRRSLNSGVQLFRISDYFLFRSINSLRK